MPFYQVGSIKYYKFPSLEKLGVYHAVFTRHGGFSPKPWKSLNFGASVGDKLERVQQNRARALEVMDIDPESVYDVYQVHSTDIMKTDRPLAMGEAHIKADGIITDRSGVTLMMRFADCVPILLVDPNKHVIGMVHAGWQGTVKKIAGKAVTEMSAQYGTAAQDIVAAIGPSIGPDHYPVGSEVVEQMRLSFKDSTDLVLENINGKTHLDLWKANQLTLEEAGVTQVEVAGICTQCHADDWYSHRCEQGKTGRFGIILGLE